MNIFELFLLITSIIASFLNATVLHGHDQKYVELKIML